MKRVLAVALAFTIGLVPFGMVVPVTAEEAAEPDRVVDRELVVVRLTAGGEILRTTLLDSLTLFGDGPVAVTDIGAPRDLRNLHGFQKPVLSGNRLTWKTNVRGTREILTSASADRRLPASVTPRYFLNGKAVASDRLGGATGDVAIEYRLVNRTAKTQVLEFTDRLGTKITEPVETYVPLVAQVSMELPPGVWSRISAPGGHITTDERKVSHLTFSSVLAPLIGSVDQTVRIEGRVRNFRLSETRVVFLPLVPPGVEEQAVSTGEATQKLFDGVGEVDANLLKLYDGTLKLIDGLSRLYEGILEARAGVGSVTEDETIVGGLKQVLDGLKTLGDTKLGLPAAKAGVDSLIAGVEQVLAGLGSSTTPKTVLGGLRGLDDGLAALRGAAGPPATGLTAIKGGIDATSAGVAGIAGLMGTAPASPAVPSAATSISNDLQFLRSIGESAATACDAYAAALGAASCTSLGIGAGTMAAVAGSAQTKLDVGRTCLTTGGIPSVCAGSEPNGVTEALAALSAGTQLAIDSVGTPASGLLTLRGGLAAVTAGVNLIKAGLSSGDPNNPKILEGLQAVAAGLAKAVAGVGTVGTDETLTDGVNRLFEGSQDLAGGLDQIAGGVFDARTGAQTIAQGQYLVSEVGTRAIRAGVGDKVEEASRAAAVIGAMKERAATGAFLYGPPAGGSGSTTYVFKVAGVSARDFTTPLKFAVAGLMLLGLLGVGFRAMRKP